MNGITWVGPKVKCYNPSLEKGWCDFYKSFSYKGEQFDIGEFAIITLVDSPNKARVARLMSVYHSHEKWHRNAQSRGCVRCYTWAKDLDPEMNKSRIRFDRQNEILEDTRSTDIIISLVNIQKKCQVIFGMADDPVHLIKDIKLSANSNFSCRYKIEECGKIVPYFGNGELCPATVELGFTELTSDGEASDLEPSSYISPKKIIEASPITKATPFKTSPTKVTNYKRKPSHVDTPELVLDSEGSEVGEKYNDKIPSLSNPSKTMRLTPKSRDKKSNGAFASPANRNSSVKRVLNDSFESMAISPSGIPTRTYSIVNHDCSDDKNIKMTLKWADENQNLVNLKVFPTTLDDQVVSMQSPIKMSDLREIGGRIERSPSKPQTPAKIGCSRRKSGRLMERTSSVGYFSPHGTPSKIDSRRRSSRTIERKSYAEFISPEKRIRRTSTDSNCSRTPLREPVKTKLLNKIEEDQSSDDEGFGLKRNTMERTKTVEKLPSDSEENDKTQKSPSKKAKLISSNGDNPNLTTPSHNCSAPKHKAKKDVNNGDKYSTPRSKRTVGCPNNVDDKDEPSQRSDTELDFKSPTRQTRSVGRPRKHVPVKSNSFESSDKLNSRRQSDDEQLTSKGRRNVGRPKKFADDFTISRASPKQNSRKPVGNNNNIKKQTVSKQKRDHSEDTESKPKRSVRPPKKYIDSDESDSVDDKSNSAKKTLKSPTKPYNTPSVNKRDLRRSVLKSTSKKMIDSEEEGAGPKTPKHASKVSTPKSSRDTPTARARMIREGVITPSVQARQKAILKDNTPLSKARTKLHVSYVPKDLPCREKEFADIMNFLEGKLLDGCGGCMYVSGVPGTGKTATVTEIIRILQESAENDDVPDFKYVNINGMRLSEPRQSYVEIVKQLMGKTVPWEQAQTMLENKFVRSQKKCEPIILVVDELDILCTKRQDVVYNLLDWPTKAHAQLIVITIANTMDLPERLLMGRVTSRLGLTRLTFQAYTHKQLQEIVTKRLSGIKAFNPDAIQLVARKVASVSGDARRALDICRRAAEIAELEGKDMLVSMIHVNKALSAMITQPKVQAIKRCSRLEKLLLQAVVAEVERTGVEETNFASILTMLLSLAVLDGFQMVSNTIAMAAVTRLSACRLLLTDHKCNNIYQRIILNVSTDDVYYALTRTDF